jgi:hypothetical protein
MLNLRFLAVNYRNERNGVSLAGDLSGQYGLARVLAAIG